MITPDDLWADRYFARKEAAMKEPGTYTLSNGQTVTIVSAEQVSDDVVAVTVDVDIEEDQ